MVNNAGDQAAPGTLEALRALLNTWRIPNDTREAEDRFEAYADDAGLSRAERRELLSLRDELRRVVERTADTDAVVNDWTVRLDVRPRVSGDGVGFVHRGGPAGDMVTAALDAIAAGRWHRLKACPDCRWVFYDHSRNGAKRWCLMTAGGPDGRSCGSIAKVRAHRQRARDAE
ncbi:CGNR zinc finger domain-containing protein [Glycomyces scopariae]